MHHLVRNQPNLAAVNQAQSLKTISIRPRILVSTWTCVLKKRTHTGGYKGTFLKIEESNDHKQIFQVTWPKDLKRANFPCIWPKTWPRTNFLNIWLINWPRAKVPKYDQETSQKKKFMDTSNSTSQ